MNLILVPPQQRFRCCKYKVYDKYSLIFLYIIFEIIKFLTICPYINIKKFIIIKYNNQT